MKNLDVMSVLRTEMKQLLSDIDYFLEECERLEYCDTGDALALLNITMDILGDVIKERVSGDNEH